MRPSGCWNGAAMPDDGQIRETARQFAKALDERDYQAGAQCLADNCRYALASDNTYVGRDAIIASYRESDEKADREFDRVTYSSDVSLGANGSAIVTFVDELQKCDATHTFRCLQIVYFGENERINRIEHCEIPGERERLTQFRKAVHCTSS